MSDILERLRYLAKLERGTPFPPPLWADDPDWKDNNWDIGIRKILHEAIAEIETLRADVIFLKNIGQSFRDIKQEINNGPSV